ncbi:MAG: hypothetical protein Q8Q42_04600 [Nanoarchaeota archaeon]|nr:hypothetical protein [Nanoarchaeota archaeon]
MNKRGTIQWIFMINLFLVLIIMFALLSRINAAKDDTGYNLEYYTRDIAYGTEVMLWSDANEISYIYPMKKGYGLVIDSDAGKVFARKGSSYDDFDFRVRDGFTIEAEPIKKEGYENPYIIVKKPKGGDSSDLLG